MERKKTFLASLCIILLAFIVSPVILIVAVDPCHIFHRPLPGVFFHGFTSDVRCQNAGLINTYLSDKNEGFDSIFLGTSISGNFMAEHIAAKTHWKRTLKLTMPGALPVEQKIRAERALEAGNIRHVFWEFFPYLFLKDGAIDSATLLKKNEFPVYLYNRSRLDDYRYIFNLSTLSSVIDVFRKSSYNNIMSIERIDFWDNGCSTEKTCQPFHWPEDIVQFRKDYQVPHNVHRTQQEISGIDFSAADKFLLAVLLPRCNTDVSFDLIFPPVSLFWFSKQNEAEFDYQLYMLRYVVAKTAACSNIHVYAFNNEQWITGDLAHYHDPKHFYGGVQDYIIDSIATGKHVITMDNIEEFEKRFIDNVNSYVPWASTEEQLRNSPH